MGLASAFLFGAATPASKALLENIQPQSLAGLLYFGAALGVLPLVLREKTFNWPWQAGRSTFFFLSGAILLGGIMGPLLLLLGLRATNAGDVSLWLNLEFVATVILGHFVFREHLSARGWIAACGTLIASVLLVEIEGGNGVVPFLLIASGCLCWGFDNHLTALIDGISPAQTTFWKGLFAGVFNSIMGGAFSIFTNRPELFLGAMILGAISYGISIIFYILAAQGLGAVRSQILFSLAPFIGLFLAVTALGESLTIIQVVAAGIIILSLIILFSENHAHVHRHTFVSHQHQHTHDGSHHNHRHNGVDGQNEHTHWHDHHPERHDHEHWPDLHHRHSHKDDDER